MCSIPSGRTAGEPKPMMAGVLSVPSWACPEMARAFTCWVFATWAQWWRHRERSQGCMPGLLSPAAAHCAFNVHPCPIPGSLRSQLTWQPGWMDSNYMEIDWNCHRQWFGLELSNVSVNVRCFGYSRKDIGRKQIPSCLKSRRKSFSNLTTQEPVHQSNWFSHWTPLPSNKSGFNLLCWCT